MTCRPRVTTVGGGWYRWACGCGAKGHRAYDGLEYAASWAAEHVWYDRRLPVRRPHVPTQRDRP